MKPKLKLSGREIVAVLGGLKTEISPGAFFLNKSTPLFFQHKNLRLEEAIRCVRSVAAMERRKK